jgi:hypothetical protein
LRRNAHASGGEHQLAKHIRLGEDLSVMARVLSRWLAWISLVGGILLFLQGFGLGGIIGTYGLVLDLIGFVLFLLFVLLSSAILLRNPSTASLN